MGKAKRSRTGWVAVAAAVLLLAWLIGAYVPIRSERHRADGVAAPAQKGQTAAPEVTRTILTADGGRLQMYNQERLVFYDGVGDGAKMVAEVPCKEMGVTPSAQGKYVAVVTQYIQERRNVEIYDSGGRKLASFELAGFWDVLAVSDRGGLLGLAPHGPELPRSEARLARVDGTVVFDDPGVDSIAHIGFSLAGVPFVWGAHFTDDTRARQSFVKVLDGSGKVVWEYRPAAGASILHTSVSAEAERFLLAVASPDSPDACFADRLEFNDFRTKTARSLPLPPHSEGVIQGPPALTPDGGLAAIRIGATRVYLLDIEQNKVIFDQNLKTAHGRNIRLFTGCWISGRSTLLTGLFEGDAKIGREDSVAVALDRAGKVLRTEAFKRSGPLGVAELPRDRVGIYRQRGDLLTVWRL